MKKLHFKDIDSTNRYLKAHYETLDDMTWLRADYQTAGRGSQHSVWFGNQESLMCSILLKKEINQKTIHLLQLLSAQVLHKVLSMDHKDILIKWPNDLLILDKKLSGILVESVLLKDQVLAVIIGFGININQYTFDESIKEIATSLALSSKKMHDIDTIYDRLIVQFDKDFLIFKTNPQETIDYCNRYHALNDQVISFMDEDQRNEAKVIKIQDDGTLLVLKDHKEMALSHKDISIIIPIKH